MGRYGLPSFQRLCYSWALAAGSGSYNTEKNLAQADLNVSKFGVQACLPLDAHKGRLKRNQQLESCMIAPKWLLSREGLSSRESIRLLTEKGTIFNL